MAAAETFISFCLMFSKIKIRLKHTLKSKLSSITSTIFLLTIATPHVLFLKADSKIG